MYYLSETSNQNESSSEGHHLLRVTLRLQGEVKGNFIQHS